MKRMSVPQRPANSPANHPRQDASPRHSKRNCILAGAILVSVAGAMAVWSSAQQAAPPASVTGDTPLDPAVRRELARWAILKPREFAAEMNKLKTPEDVLKEQLSAFAIHRPLEYEAERERFKTDEERQREALSRLAIREPEKYNALVEPLKTPEERQRSAQARANILNPRFKSRTVPGLQNSVTPAKP